jgi:hypothetical protein
MSQSQSQSQSNSTDSETKDKEPGSSTSTSTSTTRPKSPHLHAERPRSAERSSQKSIPLTSSRTPSRSPARSLNEQTEQTRPVEWVDEDGISHWHHARPEHANVHTECGRHGDDWLFGGLSLVNIFRGLIGRR